MTLEDRIATLIGQSVTSLRPLHGGDLSDVFRADPEHGDSLVIKRGLHVATEARMLQRMRDTGTPVPEVVAAQDDLFAMTYLPEGAATKAAWHGFGRAVRAMHENTGPQYGWPEPYAFGTVRIDNRPCPTWSGFWVERRLAPLLPHLPKALADRLDQQLSGLGALLPDTPPPGLLHGDLWTGNVHFGADGQAWMIDPACYFGHGEVDLAMLCLFGTPPDAFFDAYGPLAPGWERRRAVYQLWPALLHVALFGPGYHGMVARLLDQLGA